MRRHIPFLALLFAAVSLFMFSCTFGMQPAWKTGAGTTVSMNLAMSASEAGRAIAPGTVYVYIRTVGGPVGETGPFYGPYPVSQLSSKFTTTDIPAGTYEGIGVLVANEPLEGRSVYDEENNTELTFAQLMSAPDDLFKVYSDSEGDSLFDQMVAGYASGHFFDAVTITAGVENTLSATLLPMMSYETVISAEYPYPAYLPIPASGQRGRQYLMINNIDSTHDRLVIEGYTESNPAATISVFGLYSAAGKLLSLTPINQAAGNTSWELPFTAGADQLYLFIDYTGMLSLSVTSKKAAGGPVEPGNTMTVNFSFDASSAIGSTFVGKTLFVGVYTATALTEDGPPSAPPLGVGMAKLEGAGSVTIPVQINAYTTDTAASFAPYEELVIMAFVDIGSRYSFTSTSEVTNILEIQPRFGDYSTDKGILYTAGSGLNLVFMSSADLHLNEDYMLYVSNAGGGTGLSPSSPLTFTQALAATLPSGIEGLGIILTEDIQLSAPIVIERNVYLGSVGAEALTISPNYTGASSSFITVQGIPEISTTWLSLNNVIIDGTTLALSNYPAISVLDSGHLHLWEGSGVRNFHTTSPYGGAVYASGGGIEMDGGFISGNEAISGGGVYLDAYSYAKLMAGTISGNTAEFGGGVYVASSGNVFLYSSALSITANTAESDAGGLYVADYATLSDPGNIRVSVVTGNTAPSGMNFDIYLSAYAIVTTDIFEVFASANGTGLGLTPEEPTNFMSAIANPSIYGIILVSDIPVSTGITIDRSVMIDSLDSQTRYSIYPSVPLSGPLLTVSGEASVDFYNVILGPETASAGTSATSLVYAGPYSYVMLDNVLLRNNQSALSGTRGGALHAEDSTLDLVASEIVSCSAERGGAIYANGAMLYLEDSRIANSSAWYGGAIYLESNSLTERTGFLDLFGSLSVIEFCTAQYDGGGIYLASGEATIAGSDINNNTANGSGGGMYVAAGVTAGFNYYVEMPYYIRNNRAALGGGLAVSGAANYSEYPAGSMEAQITGNTNLDYTTIDNISVF